MERRRIIGLTGGIATGKSTVTNYLQDTYRLSVLDADIYAREATVIDTPIYEEILLKYGSHLRLFDRSLDRRALGEIIFNNPTEKKWLEAKIHPYVVDRILVELGKLKDETIVLAIPLLFEAEMTYLVTEIWVVACSLDLQLKRLQERDRLTVAAAKTRVKNQLPLATKIAAADVVLDNNSSLEDLYKQIDAVITKI